MDFTTMTPEQIESYINSLSIAEVGVQLRSYEGDITKLVTPNGDTPIPNADVLRAEKLDGVCDKLRARLDENNNAVAKANELRTKTTQKMEQRSQPKNIIQAPVEQGDIRFKDARPFYRTLNVYAGREEEAYRDGLWLAGALATDPDARMDIRTKGKEKYGFEYRTMSEGNNSGGGYLVPVEFANSIINQQLEYGIARKLCDVVPMTGEIRKVARLKPGIDNQVTAYWGGENASMTDANALWDQIELKAKKLYALFKFSNELGEDAIIDMADTGVKSASMQLSFKEDRAWLKGAGEAANGNITGVISGLTAITNPVGVVTQAVGNTWGAVTDSDLLNVMAKLPRFQGIKPVWLCSEAAYRLIFRRLVRAGGGNTITLLAQGGAQYEYEGVPVVIVADPIMPNATAVSTYPIIYGDPKMGTLFGQRRDLTVALSDQAGTAFTDDQTWVKVTERIDENNYSLGGSTDDASPLGGAYIAFKTGA